MTRNRYLNEVVRMNFDKASDRPRATRVVLWITRATPEARPGGDITQRVARAYGYAGDMRSFPVTDAKRIARTGLLGRCARR